MDTTTSRQRISSLPVPPPPPPLPEHRTTPSADTAPGWLPVVATVVAQVAWLVVVFVAWVVAIVVIASSSDVVGTGPDHVDTWFALASVAAAGLAPVPTVAYVLSRRRSPMAAVGPVGAGVSPSREGHAPTMEP